MGRMRLTALGTFAVGSVLLAACSSPSSMTSAKGMGRVRMSIGGSATQAMTASRTAMELNDGSGRSVTAATISLSAIEARNLDGQLVAVTTALPMDVDLVALMQGGTVDLPDGTLPAATYDQIVVVIRSLHVALSDGTQVDVTPPGGGWTVVVPTDQFDVIAGQVTTVHLHFNGNGAFQMVNGQLVFNPSFGCDVDHHHGGGDDGEND